MPAPRRSPPPHRTRSAAVIDTDLRRWLADPASRIPVRGREHRNGAAGTVLWATLARLIYPGDRSRHIFAGAAGQRRRALVTAAAAAGRVHIADGEADPALGRLDCAGFAVVTRADGTTGPGSSGSAPASSATSCACSAPRSTSSSPR